MEESLRQCIPFMELPISYTATNLFYRKTLHMRRVFWSTPISRTTNQRVSVEAVGAGVWKSMACCLLPLWSTSTALSRMGISIVFFLQPVSRLSINTRVFVGIVFFLKILHKVSSWWFQTFWRAYKPHHHLVMEVSSQGPINYSESETELSPGEK